MQGFEAAKRRTPKTASGADGGAECRGDGLGKAFDVGVMFGFDHDSRKLFRAGIAQYDAAVFAESGIGFAERADDFWERIERRLGFDLHVDDGLRIVLETGNERIEAALHGDERSHFDGGEKAVAGGRIIEKNDVAGLFAAQDVSAFEHFFENVAVADVGAGKRNVLVGENPLETKIGHGCGDDAIAREFVLRLEITRHGKKDAVAVDNSSIGRNKERAIGVAIESDAKSGALGGNALLQFFEVERAAACIDIAAIGLCADVDGIAAK